MDWNKHFHLRDKHAFLSPSRYFWVNYDTEKLVSRYNRSLAAKKGTKLHRLAQQCIDLRIRLPKTTNSLNQYVNDGIGFKMNTEQVLFFSPNAFGTADTISFRNNFLRIHDYKSGRGRVSMTQLEIYASLFCLEYNKRPDKIKIELRIYQLGQIITHDPGDLRIRDIMDKIVIFDKKINEINFVMEA